MTVFEGSADELKEVDILIAGGGTAACVLATRLAQADPSLSILIVEHGRNSYNDPLVTTPAMFSAHLGPDSQTAWFYQSQASDNMAGQEPVVPQGKILGGSSSINHMMYSRPQKSDLDGFNAEGWGYEDLLPLFKKMETFHPAGPTIDKSVHGFHGPIQVSDGGFRTPKVEGELLRSAESLGYATTEDIYDFQSINEFMALHRYVSPEGIRQDVSHRYLHPLLQDGQHLNLHVIVHATVVRAFFDKDNRAQGIEYYENKSRQTVRRINAKRQVIVSCGALGTPQVLERSGIGSKQLLDQLNIRVISDLPGVGENYQDHQRIVTPYKTSLKPGETMDEFLRGGLNIAKAKSERDPILGFNALNFAGKVRPSEEELPKLGAAVQEAWKKDYKDLPLKPLAIIANLQGYAGDPSLLPPNLTQTPIQYMTMGAASTYPYSRGSIHIASANPSDAATFNANYISDRGGIDLKIQVWAYKLQRDLIRRCPFYRGELPPPFHPAFPATSSAALELDIPLTEGSIAEDTVLGRKRLEYSAEDDEILESFIRRTIGTVWHPACTCAMKPQAAGGVVDEKLDVYGVTGLKLVDLSIIPDIVSANTYSMAVVVGEKAANIIRGELGI